jgi:hypothetical protein
LKSVKKSKGRARIVQVDPDCDDLDSILESLPQAAAGTATILNKRGLPVTPGGRPSVKKNAVNAKYSGNYRNPLNTQEILGKKVSIGRACAVLGIVQLGPNIRLEEAGHDERLRVFKDAAFYALSEEDLEEILNTEEAALRLYLLGIFRAQCRIIKFVAPANARSEFEHCVFHTATRDPEIQKHLGLSITESVFDQ